MDRLTSAISNFPGLFIILVGLAASVGGFLPALTAQRTWARSVFAVSAALCALITLSALWISSDNGLELGALAFVIIAVAFSAISLLLFVVGLTLAWRRRSRARAARLAASQPVG